MYVKAKSSSDTSHYLYNINVLLKLFVVVKVKYFLNVERHTVNTIGISVLFPYYKGCLPVVVVCAFVYFACALCPFVC